MIKNRSNSRASSVLGAALTRLSARIAPRVREQIAATLIADLERHFDERLLPAIGERAVAMVVQELPGRIKAILARELPEQVEAILKRELPGQIDKVIDHALSSKQSYEQLSNPQFYSPNNIVASSVTGEYMTASNALARDFLHPEFYDFCQIFKHPVVMHPSYGSGHLSIIGYARQVCFEPESEESGSVWAPRSYHHYLPAWELA